MEERIKKAAAILQAVALGQESAQKAMATIARMVDADSAMFANSNGLPDGAQPFDGFNVDPNAFPEYVTSFATRDVQLQAIAEKFGTAPPPVIIDDDILSYTSFTNSELFNDFYRFHDIHRVVRLESCELSRHGIATMRLLFTRGKRAGQEKGTFKEHERNILTALSPYFDAAAILFVERSAKAHASLAAAFEHVADAVAILNIDGRMRYANAAFEVLRKELDPHAKWYWAAPLESPTFHILKTAFRAALIETGAASLSAKRCQFALVPPPPRSAPRRFLGLISTALTSAGVKTRNREPLFLLVLRESAVMQNERVLALRWQHGLTPMETRVLRRFADGEDANTIAAGLRVTLHTVRAHMKSLLSKTGCRKQTELVRLLEMAPTRKIRLLI